MFCHDAASQSTGASSLYVACVLLGPHLLLFSAVRAESTVADAVLLMQLERITGYAQARLAIKKARLAHQWATRLWLHPSKIVQKSVKSVLLLQSAWPIHFICPAGASGKSKTEPRL